MDVCAVQSVELSLDCGPDLNVQIKPISTCVEGGAQVQQIINVECRGVFFEPLLLDIKFQSVCSLYYTFACAMYTRPRALSELSHSCILHKPLAAII